MARNKYPEETKRLIIDTAARLFMEYGYDHTSIQDIIQHLGGLTKGAIYHHFKSKEEIMWAVAEKIYVNSDAAMEKVCMRKDLNGLEKLKELFRVSLFHPAQKDMFEVAPDFLKNSQLLVLYLKEGVQKEAPQVVRKILEEGIADGSIHTDYPKELAEVIMLVANFWLNPMIYHSEPEEMVRKVKFYQHMLRLLDLDVIEDKMVEQLKEFALIYHDGKK